MLPTIKALPHDSSHTVVVAAADDDDDDDERKSLEFQNDSTANKIANTK